MISFQHVTKRYSTGHVALRDINLTIDKGEMVFITGHSGAGKSSFLKLISLIERADQGRMFVKQHDYRYVNDWQIPWIRRQMGIVFQDPMLLFENTVYDNVALPLVVGGYRHKDIQKRVQAALSLVDLGKKSHLKPNHLSCGEQQRVGIARAIVHKPPILLADEPTGNLDPTLSKNIIELFYQFHHVGVTVVIATHDLNLIKQFDKRVVTLKQGQVCYDEIKVSEANVV